jgi:hypothetical protein
MRRERTGGIRGARKTGDAVVVYILILPLRECIDPLRVLLSPCVCCLNRLWAFRAITIREKYLLIFERNTAEFFVETLETGLSKWAIA